MVNTLVSGIDLYTIGHYPLVRDTLFGFNLDRKPENVEYMPQLGFLALNEAAEEGKSLVGFRVQGSELLYSHPHAVLALPGVSTVEVCSVPLSDEPKIVDIRSNSGMSWRGRIIQSTVDLVRAPAEELSEAVRDADIIIEPQPLWEGVRQAIRMRTFYLSKFLPPSIAHTTNQQLTPRVLGRYT